MTEKKENIRLQFKSLNNDTKRKELKQQLKSELENAKKNVSRIENDLLNLENESRHLIKQFAYQLILENPTVYACWWYGPLATGGCDSIWRTKEQALQSLHEFDNCAEIETDVEETVKPRKLANMEIKFIEEMAIREMLE